MILDIVGGKVNGRWDAGAFTDKNMPPHYLRGMTHENMVWYRQGLIDFHNRLFDIIDAGRVAKERAESADKPTPKPLPPLLDTSYAATSEEMPERQSGDSYSGYVVDQDSDEGIHG